MVFSLVTILEPAIHLFVHWLQLEKCFIGHNVNFTNDKFSSKKLGGSIKTGYLLKLEIMF